MPPVNALRTAQRLSVLIAKLIEAAITESRWEVVSRLHEIRLKR